MSGAANKIVNYFVRILIDFMHDLIRKKAVLTYWVRQLGGQPGALRCSGGGGHIGGTLLPPNIAAAVLQFRN